MNQEPVRAGASARVPGRHPSPLPAATVLLSLLSGCAGGDTSTPRHPSHPFAGEERLVIGRVDSLPGHSLYRVAGAHWNPSVGLIVADGATGEIRIFNVAGELVRTIGKLGQGPGEFLVLSRLLHASGDTLFAFDGARSTISIWTTSDGYIQNQTVDLGILPLDARGATLAAVKAPRGEELGPGRMRLDSASILLARPGDSTGLPTQIMQRPWQTYLAMQAPTGQVVRMPHPLQPKGAVAFGENCIFVGYPDAWKVGQYSMKGEHQRTIVIDIPRRVLSPDLVDIFRRPYLERTPEEQRAEMQRYLQNVPLPDSLPAYDQLLVDRAGNLWLRQFTIQGETVSDWYVAGPDGSIIEQFQMAAGARILQIGPGFIVAHIRPEDSEAEEVILYELHDMGSSQDMN